MLHRCLRRWLFACLLLARPSAHAQALSPTTVKQLDALFQAWAGTATPGGAVGIIRHDSLLYAKGFGMANLESGSINTPQTLFNIGSVSKQFTAYAVVLLARQGKLNLDEDVRHYLPWFPDLKARITLRHLLTHTSGVRDYLELWAAAGADPDDMQSMPRARQVLRRQRALNFPPGTDWLYSNSGFVLLADVVQAVSHRSLRAFTDSAIFQPLGMQHTHFQDDYSELLPGRAAGYDRRGPATFRNHALTSAVVGDGGLYTNVEDMSKWLRNFYAPTAGDRQDVATLVQRAQLTNGKLQAYALGIGHALYHGQPFYSHGGLDGGYRAFSGVFPQQQLGFVVLSNLRNADPESLVHQMADLFIKDPTSQVPAAKPLLPDSSQAALADTAWAKKLAGTYRSEDGAEFTYRLQHQKLYWVFRSGRKSLLIKTQADTFAVLHNPGVRFLFGANPGAAPTVHEYWPGHLRVLYRVDPAHILADKQLRAYTGAYHSPELDSKYDVVLRDHQLLLLNSRSSEEFKLAFVRPDVLQAPEAGYALKVLRNGPQKVTGFTLSSGRMRNLYFSKDK